MMVLIDYIIVALFLHGDVRFVAMASFPINEETGEILASPLFEVSISDN